MATQDRHLAAILFTDIVGYTSMMQLDESRAVGVIKRYHEILEKAVPYHQGEVLNNYGDGSLCSFPSVYEALKCAIELQRELNRPPIIPLRVGLHIGEIFFEHGKVLGDGVNIASRIQSMGTANSILFSSEVYNSIKNHPEFKAVLLGTFEFKNVETPMAVYALSNEGLFIPKKEELTGKLKEKRFSSIWKKIVVSAVGLVLILAAILGLHKYITSNNHQVKVANKSIAVLPFVNLSNDHEQDYFSNGIAEDILNHLVKVSDLKVKSRTSTIQYKNTKKSIIQIGEELGVNHILEGSVRKVDNQVRVVVQLIDAKNDVQLWSETYDREFTDILAIQSEIAIQTVNALQGQLTSAELSSIKKGPSANIVAYDYFIKAREEFNNGSLDKLHTDHALALVNQAIHLDQQFAQAYALKARIFYQSRSYGVSEKAWRDSSLFYSTKSISIDASLPEGYFARALIYYYLGNINSYRTDLTHAYSLAPNDPEILERYGYQLLNDKNETGADLVIAAIENKYMLNDPQYYISWDDALYFLDDAGVNSRERILQKSISLYPESMNAYFNLGDLYRSTGEYKKAIAIYEQIQRINPDLYGAVDGLAWAHFLNGNYQMAIQQWSRYKEFEARFEDTTQTLPYRHRLGMAYSKAGDKEKADELFKEQYKISTGMLKKQQSRGVWGSSIAGLYYDIAVCEAYFGDRDEMVADLDSAFMSYNFFWTWGLRNDPMWENYQSDEKFKALQKRNEETVEFKKRAFTNAINRLETSEALKGLLR